MGMGIPTVFPKWYHGYGYSFGFWHTTAHHVPIPQCCGYSTGKLQWVILTIRYFYSHFLPFFPLFFWYCNGFGVVAILGMLRHKYHYFLILAVQLLTYISYFRVHQLLISCDFFVLSHSHVTT